MFARGHHPNSARGLEKGRRRGSITERFTAKIDRSGDCWNWTGATSTFGYGKMIVNGRHVDAHRISYSMAHGDIPAGQLVCHRCDNPRCVRPDHLFLGTQKDNIIDMAAKHRRKSQQRTHCRYGHEFTAENTIARGLHGRRCRACRDATHRHPVNAQPIARK